LILKKGVKLGGVRPETVLAMSVCERVFDEVDKPLVVTSVMDGQHMQGSLHYEGLAFDFRTFHLGDKKDLVFNTLRLWLGPEFDVLDENDHGHIEWQQK
jgi:hypothetical protein